MPPPVNLKHAPRRNKKVVKTDPKEAKKVVSPSQHLTKCLWGLFCLTGLMYQSVLVTKDYAKYPVTSQVTIEMEKEFEPVTFSFCLESVSVRIQQKFPPKSVCRGYLDSVVNATLYDMCIQELIYDYDVKSIMDNYTIDLMKTITQVQVLESDLLIAKRVTLNQSLDYMEYYPFLKASFKCLRVQHKMDQSVRLDLLSKLLVERNMFVVGGSLQSIREEAPFMIIYVHDHNTFPYGIENKHFPESIAHGIEGKQLSFQKTSSHYLPPPFFTRCYSGDRYESKGHCIETCQKEKLHQEYGYSYYGMTVVDSNERIKFGKFTGDKYRRLMEISRECQERCPLTCRTNNYLPVLASSYGGHPRTYRIHIAFDYPTIRVEFSAKLTFLEYLIYIASCSGLWFGFCLYSSLEFVSGAACLSINRCRKKKVSQHIVNHINAAINTC